MTQEIGKIGWDLDDPINLESFPVGSTLSLIPYHACATAAMYPVGLRTSFTTHSLKKGKSEEKLFLFL